MGILAIGAMSNEGKVGTAVNAGAVSSLPSKVDFATELNSKIQANTSPNHTPSISEPERASVKGSSSINATSLSPGITTTVIQTAPDKKLEAPSASSVEPAETSSILQLPPLARPLPAGQHGSTSFAGSTSERQDAGVILAKAAIQSGVSVLPKVCGVGSGTRASDRDPRSPVRANDTSTEQRNTSNTTSPTRFGRGSPSAVADTVVPLPSITIHTGPQDTSRTASAPQATSSTELGKGRQSSAAETTVALPIIAINTGLQGAPRTAIASEAISPSQLDMRSQGAATETSAPLASVTTLIGPQDASGQVNTPEATVSSKLGKGTHSAAVDTFTPLPGTTTEIAAQDASGPVNTPQATISSKLGNVSQSAKMESFAPLQNATTRVGLQDASGPLNTSQATSLSELHKGSRSAAVDACAPLRSITTQIGPQDHAGRTTTPDATTPTPLGEGSQSAPMKTIAPLLNGTTQVSLQDPPNAPNPKGEASQDEGYKGSSPNQAAPAETTSSLQPSPRAEDSSNPQLSGPAQGVITGQEGTTPAGGLTTTWEQIETVSLSNVDEGLQTAGVPTKPLHQGTTRSEPQDQPSAGDASTPRLAETGPETSSRPRNETGPDASNPAQTNNSDAASSAPNTKQVDASADKNGGTTAQDVTKVTDGKGGSPKTNADPTFAPQLTPEGPGEAGRASSGAAGTSPGRVEADGEGALQGYQANAPTAVSSARITQQAGNAQMQVRLRTETLGPIDVHTVVKGSDIGASIRVEAHETQVALANELSQLERALNERSLRVEHLDVLQGSVSGGHSNGAGPGNSGGSPSERRPSFSSYPTSQTHISSPELPTVPEDAGLGLSMTRINLRV